MKSHHLRNRSICGSLAVLVALLVCLAPQAQAGQATAGQLLISEFRLRGPSGANDEYVVIYNNTNSALTVAALSGTGYSLAASDGVIRFTIPNGTVLPAHGHYLGANSVGYSLGGYATADTTFFTDIPDNAGIALFNNSTGGASFTLANRLDAVGSASESNSLYKEGTGYPTQNPQNNEYAFFRTYLHGTDANGDPTIDSTDGEIRDTDNNATDFTYVDTYATYNGGLQKLGAPAPANQASPISGYHLTPNIGQTLIDPTVAAGSPPNQVRDQTSDSANNSTFGTVEFRRTFTNNTGVPLTRLRFRIIKLTTFPAATADADLRALTSSNVAVVTAGGPKTAYGTTLEQPPSQPNGGGWNSTFNASTVTAGTPLANNASIDLRFVYGVEQKGNMRFGIVVEALPSASHLWFVTGTTEGTVSSETANTAPVLNGANNFTSINEDNKTSTGDLVSALLAGHVVDPDAGAVSGIAINATKQTNGVWQYTVNNGTTWTATGVVSATQSLLLASDTMTRVRFVPNANYNGTVTPGITFRAWDQTSGIAGTKVDTTTNGGTTAFSAATANSDIVVSPVADTPSVTNATTPVNTQTTSGLVITKNAADGAEVTSYKITNIQNGTLFQHDGVTPIVNGSFITDAEGAAGLKFTPTPTFVGTGTFDIQASTSPTNAGLGGNVITANIYVGTPPPAPTFVSGPTGTPNPGVAGSPVAFTVVTNPSDAIITWDFGDGSPTATGASVSHTYAATGTYLVTVTAKNGPNGGTSTATLFETIGTTTAATTPTIVTKGTMTFGMFGEILNMQSLLPLGRNNTAGNTITIRVNGLTRSFTLGSDGRGISGFDHVRVVRSTSQNTARVILHVEGQLKAQLAAGAPVNGAGEPTQVAVFISYQGVQYTSDQSVLYSRNLRLGRFGQ